MLLALALSSHVTGGNLTAVLCLSLLIRKTGLL